MLHMPASPCSLSAPQAAQEAFDKGQPALARELQATARSHADAAAAARRRANTSAYR